MTAWTHLRGPGPTPRVVFIVLLLPFLVSTAPLSSEETTEIEYYPVADATGCYYNFQHYDEGDRIITNEPCLNCTCHNKMLMCYLKVCPFIKAIGQDCTVEKRPDQCCPVITCPEVHVHLLTSTTTPSSTAVGHPDAYGCTIDSLFYSDGARVPSSPNKPCELCYCIRNKTACVMQECTLKIDGCQPVYQDGVCCPVRYDCEHPKWEQIETTTTTTTTTTTEITTTPALIFTTLLPGGARDCMYEGEVYADGALVKKDVPCEHCYCMKGDIVCAVQECGPTPLDKVNCTALPTGEGKCCPDTYECNGMIEELTTEMFQEFTTLPPVTKAPAATEESTDEIVHLDDRIKDDESPEQSTSNAVETTTKLYPAPTSTEEIDHQTNESLEPIQTSSEIIPSSSESDTTLLASTTEGKISSPETVTEQYTVEPTEVVTEGKDIDSGSTHEQPINNATSMTTEGTTPVPIDVAITQTSTSSAKTEIPTTLKPEQPTDHPLPELSQTTQSPAHDVYEDTKENEEPEQSTEYVPEVEKEKEPKFEAEPTVQPEKAMKAEDEAAVTPEIVTSMSIDSKVPAIAEDQVTEEIPLATTIYSEEKPEISEEVPSLSTTSPEQKPEIVPTTTQTPPSVTEKVIETSSATVEKEGGEPVAVTGIPASDKEQDKTTTRPESVTTALPVTSEEPQPHDDGFDEHPAFDENEIDSHEDNEFDEPEITSPSVKVEATTPRKISSEDEKVTSRPEITTHQSVEPQETTLSPVTKSESTTESELTTLSHSEKETPKPEVIENEIPSHDANEIDDNAIEQSTAAEPEPTKVSESDLIRPTEPGESIHMVPVTELSTEAHVSEGSTESSTQIPEQSTEKEPEEHSVHDESTKEQETTVGTTVSEPIVTVTPSAPSADKDATTKSEEPTVSTEKYSPDADITESSEPLTTSSKDGETEYTTSALPSQSTGTSTATPVEGNKQEQPSEEENHTEENVVDLTTVNPVKAHETQTDVEENVVDLTTVNPVKAHETQTDEEENIVDLTTVNPVKAHETQTDEEENVVDLTTVNPVKAHEAQTDEEENVIDLTTVNPVKAHEAQTDLPVSTTTASEIVPPTQEAQTTEKTSISDTPIEKAEQTTESLFVTTVPIIVQETTLATRETGSAEEGVGKDTEAATSASTEIPHTTYDYETTEEDRVIPGEGNCLVDGQTYKNNSSVPPINHCQVSCKCVSSILICESVSCSPPPTNLQNCMPVYQGPNSCCPTYSCSIPANTSMESDSHKIETTQRPEQTTLLTSEPKEPEEVTEIVSNVPTTVQPSSDLTTEKKGIPGEAPYETTLSPNVFPLETSSHVPQETVEEGTTSQPFNVQEGGEKGKDDTAHSEATPAPELPVISTGQPVQPLDEQTTQAPIASQTEIPAGSSTESLPEETPAFTEKEEPTSSESSVIHANTEDGSAAEKSEQPTTIRIETPSESVPNEITQSVTEESVVTERITEKQQTPSTSESYDQNTGFTSSSETEKMPTESTQKPSDEVETTTKEVVATVTPSEICKDGEPCDTATDSEPEVTEAVYTVTSQAVTEGVETVKPSEPDSSEPEQTTATESYKEIQTIKSEISESPACSEGEDCSAVQQPTTSLPLEDDENKIPELPSEAPKQQCENGVDCETSSSPTPTNQSESADHSTERPTRPVCTGENCEIPQTSIPLVHETQPTSVAVTEPTVIKACAEGTSCELTPEKTETPAPEPYKPSEGESSTSPPVAATEIITPEAADHTENVYSKGTDKPILEPEVPLHDGCDEGEDCDTGDEITEKPKPVTEVIVTERINEVCNDKECGPSNIGESLVTEHPVSHGASSESPKESCEGEECGVIKPEEQPQTSKPEEEHGGDVEPAVPSDELSKATVAPEEVPIATEKVTSPSEVPTTAASVETETPKHEQCSGDSCELPQPVTESAIPEKTEPEIQTTAVPLNKDTASEPAESSTTQIPQTTSPQAIETASPSFPEEKVTEQVPVATEQPETATELVTQKEQDVITEYPVPSTERTVDKVTEPEIIPSISTETSINDEGGDEIGSGETGTESISESVTTQEPDSNNLSPEPVEPEVSISQDTSPQPASSTAQPETPVEPEVSTSQETSPQPASSTAQPELPVEPEVTTIQDTSPQPSSSTAQPESSVEPEVSTIQDTSPQPASSTAQPESPVEPEGSTIQDTSPQPASSTAQPESPVEPEGSTIQDTSPQPASSTAQPESPIEPEVSQETSSQPSSSTAEPESTDKNIETTTLYISHTTKPAESTTSDADDGQVFTSRPVEDNVNKETDDTTPSVIDALSQEKLTTIKSDVSDTTTRMPFEPVTLTERKDESEPKPTEAYTDVPVTERIDEETQVPEENAETVTPFKPSTEKTETVTPIQEKTEPSQQPSTTTPSATTTLILQTESPATSQETLATTVANEPVNVSQSEVGTEISPESRPDEALFTSGPFEEPTTKKSVLGELSTSASVSPSFSEPITTTTVSIPSHDIPENHGPELPDYQSPIDDYEEEDQNSFGPGTCRYGGKVYVSAQQIPRDDPCDFCFCFRSDIICLQQSCPPPIPNCHEEPIRGFCCPRYECPVSMATSLNITTTSTTTTTTLPPHFLSHAYKGRAAKAGCQVRGRAFKVGDEIKSESGPCLHCTCGGDGQMQCDPKPCSPEPMLKQMISAAAKARRR